MQGTLTSLMQSQITSIVWRSHDTQKTMQGGANNLKSLSNPILKGI